MSAHSDRRMKYGAILSCQSTVTKKQSTRLTDSHRTRVRRKPTFFLTHYILYLSLRSYLELNFSNSKPSFSPGGRDALLSSEVALEYLHALHRCVYTVPNSYFLILIRVICCRRHVDTGPGQQLRLAAGKWVPAISLYVNASRFRAWDRAKSYDRNIRINMDSSASATVAQGAFSVAEAKARAPPR